MLRKIARHFERLAAERPVMVAFLVFVCAAFVVIPASLPFYIADTRAFVQNIAAEAHGMLFDLLVIGWFGFWLSKLAERRVRNNRYREEIEDFLGWRSPEATHRIAGNIRRLNRGGVQDSLRLTEAHLKDANLAGVNLIGSDLWGANMEAARLGDAKLKGANMAGANLERADLERADLTEVDLRGANLKDADLERATLKRTDLRGATLMGADLQYAMIEEANLERSNLSGANLRGARLTGSNLDRASLDGASMQGAVLAGVSLRNADVADADFEHADFAGARLPKGDALITMFERVKSIRGASFDPEVAEQLRGIHARFDAPSPREKRRRVPTESGDGHEQDDASVSTAESAGRMK